MFSNGKHTVRVQFPIEGPIYKRLGVSVGSGLIFRIVKFIRRVCRTLSTGAVMPIFSSNGFLRAEGIRSRNVMPGTLQYSLKMEEMKIPPFFPGLSPEVHKHHTVQCWRYFLFLFEFCRLKNASSI